jgi:selenide,water dikinase
MNGVNELVAEGMVPAGCYRNRDFFGQSLPSPVSSLQSSDSILPLFDPQTSGGLLISLAPDDAVRFISGSEGSGIFARRIGSVLPELQKHSVEIV